MSKFSSLVYFLMLWHYYFLLFYYYYFLMLWYFTASRASSLCVYVTNLIIAHCLALVLPSEFSFQRQEKMWEKNSA